MNRSKTFSSEAGDYQLESGDEPGFRSQESDTSSLVGDVLDAAPADSPGRILVRWRTPAGTLCQRLLSIVKSLAPENGDLVLLQRPGNWPEWLVTHVINGSSDQPPGKPASFSQTSDKRIEINAEDELVLRCGAASITLRRNGRVVIRGTYVETRSKGVNRIKGGVVLIN